MNPDQEFTVVFRRMAKGWAIIDSLRNVAALGMPYAKNIVEVQHKSFVSDLADSGHPGIRANRDHFLRCRVGSITRPSEALLSDSAMPFTVKSRARRSSWMVAALTCGRPPDLG